MWESVLVGIMRSFLDGGGLHLTLPSGRVERFGPADGPDVAVTLTDPALPRKILMNPEVALGEAYMDGTLRIAGDDVKGFLQVLMRSGTRKHSAIGWLLRLNKAMTRLSDWNPLPKARANVAHHYDISPELYGLFLDPNKQYTCAYFREPGMTLEQAQTAKMEHVGRKLLLKPGMRVLDIGCGFGTLAIALARDYDVRVLGVTLSEVQLAEARQRAVAEGVADRVEFRLQDYREVTGPFDRIVSIGMMEHVGRPHLGTYFDKVNGLLTPDGVALIHYIAHPKHAERNSPWFEKYIFPGSYCPTLAEVSPHVGRSGLILTDLEAWRGHYDPTLAGWRENFERNVDRIRALTDDRFIRMWRYYLVAAEVTFAEGLLTIHQLQLARSQDAVPKARDYLYPAPQVMDYLYPAGQPVTVSRAAR
ncbi:MAG: class I SAM-dependent methyltransferase [Pseudorhodobacter sp.]|nr:class I SAM-dependent methyltransferase [Pseudorhodobacter sp.]